jgi:hypothetical protein
MSVPLSYSYSVSLDATHAYGEHEVKATEMIISITKL